MLRTALGLVVGYAIFALSTVAVFKIANVNPHAAASMGFTIASILSGIVFAFVGGTLAGRIGGRRAGVAMALLIAILAVVSVIMAPGWSPLAAILLMAPSAYLGGRRARANQAA